MELPKILSKIQTGETPAPQPPTEPAEPQRSIGPMTFAVALTINAVVSAVLAVLLTLNFVRDTPSKLDTAQPASLSAEQAADRPSPATVAPTLKAARVDATGVDPRATPPAAVDSAALAKEPPPPAERSMVAPAAPKPRGEPVSGFTVAQSLELQYGKPSRLAFRLTPENGRRERMLISFEGLPAGSGIYGLRRLGDNIWRLDPGQSTEMLIIVPPDAPHAFSIKMGLHRDQGSLIEQHTVHVIAKR